MGRGKSGTGGTGGGGNGRAEGPGGANRVTRESHGYRYYEEGVSKQTLLGLASEGSYTTHTYTVDGVGKAIENPIQMKTLGIDVQGEPHFGGSLRSDVFKAHATVTKNSDGTFNLDYPLASGTQKDRTFKTESAAMSAGRTALKRRIEKGYNPR